jgi:hypothetical protein
LPRRDSARIDGVSGNPKQQRRKHGTDPHWWVRECLTAGKVDDFSTHASELAVGSLHGQVSSAANQGA